MTGVDRVQRQIDLMNQLYAGGPLPPAFFQWVDQSLTVLRAACGDDSPQVRAFTEAAGPDFHDPDAVMLPMHTEWGTHARMQRCRAVLDEALRALRAGQPA